MNLSSALTLDGSQVGNPIVAKLSELLDDRDFICLRNGFFFRQVTYYVFFSIFYLDFYFFFLHTFTFIS